MTFPNYAVWIAAIVLIFATGCTRTSVKSDEFRYSPDVSSETYFPASPGAAWTYDVVFYDDAGKPELESAHITRVQERIGDRVIIASGETTLTYTFRRDGLYKGEHAIIPTPIVPGANWPVNIGGVSGTGRVLSVDEKVIVKAGLFNHCLLIEEEYPKESAVLRFTYAPNVGLVRMMEMGSGPEGRVRSRADLRIFRVPASAEGL